MIDGRPTELVDVRPSGGERIPHRQYRTDKWPILHYGRIPDVGPGSWSLLVRGAVERPLELAWDDLMALPQREIVCDIHCVTGWSRLDTRFTGIPLTEIARRAVPRDSAMHVLVHATDAWTSSLPAADLVREDVLLAHAHDGEPLRAEHGGPLRLVVPHLYFFKSAKWVTGLEFLTEDRQGFWERNGYHTRGDPWREQRFAW